MKTKIIRAIALATVPLLAMIWGSAAQAIPAWGKQHGKECSSCHKAWPQLTKEGRDFKENGYRLEDEIGEKIEYDSLPWSAIFVARPYDKKDSGSAKYRVLHELEIFLGGAIGEKWSGYFNAKAVPKRVSSGPTRTRRCVPAWIRGQCLSVVKFLDNRVEGYDPAGE